MASWGTGRAPHSLFSRLPGDTAVSGGRPELPELPGRWDRKAAEQPWRQPAPRHGQRPPAPRGARNSQVLLTGGGISGSCRAAGSAGGGGPRAQAAGCLARCLARCSVSSSYPGPQPWGSRCPSGRGRPIGLHRAHVAELSRHGHSARLLPLQPGPGRRRGEGLAPQTPGSLCGELVIWGSVLSSVNVDVAIRAAPLGCRGSAE